MKTVRGKAWGVPRGKQYVRGWVNPYRPILEAEREAQERPNIACLFYGDLENETPEQFLLRQEEVTLLQRAIDRLDARYARTIRLRYMEGLTLDEVGEQYGLTREAIRQIQRKAERKLLRYLKLDFHERFNSVAKRHDWWWNVEKAKQAEKKEKEAELVKRREAREAERYKQQRIMVEREREALEINRIKAQNARRYSPPMVSLYQPRLIDPATGAWEWVKVGRSEINDASAA